MRLFTTSPCHVTKIGNKTANINAKNIVTQLHIENSKNKKMVIKLLQQSTFRRYAAKVLSPFFYCCCFRCVTVPLTGVINYVFCIYLKYWQHQMYITFMHVHLTVQLKACSSTLV